MPVAQPAFLPGVYTIATLPAANQCPLCVAWVSDAPTQQGGTEVGAMKSDGSSWKPMGGTSKRIETYAGTTNSSGLFVVTFPVAFSAAPNIQPVIISGTTEQSFTVSALSTTGCTISVRERASLTVLSINLLSFATTAVNGAAVRVLVVES